MLDHGCQAAAFREPANVWTNLQAMLVRISAAEVEAVVLAFWKLLWKALLCSQGKKSSCRVAHARAGLEPH